MAVALRITFLFQLPPNEFLNIDAILEGVMHRIIIRPLKQHIYHCFVDEYSR